MRRLLALVFALPGLALATAQEPKQPDAQKGARFSFSFAKSKVFPGTTRNVTVYVPAQYDGKTPACVYVSQDGLPGYVDTTFDALIASKDMPVTIAVGVTPGVVKAADGKTALDRFNRSYEYDGLGDGYARMILDELLPEVEKQKTKDGRAIVLSRKGADRAIGGASSGAICAFTAAWERPDAFTRVFSTIGTYVGLRGGDVYPALIRKFEPKPIRVYLQDGNKDLNIYGGDWWMANQTMERALVFSGYEVQHSWNEGGHDGSLAAKVFADASKFLWKDWPEAPKAGLGSAQMKELLIPGEGWKLVGEGYKFTEGPATSAKGEVFFNDVGDATWIWLDPDRLAARKLTTEDVIAALKRENVQVAAGPAGPPPKPAGQALQLTVTSQGRLADVKQFEGALLTTGDAGQKVYLRDVARVELVPSKTYKIVDGKPEEWLKDSAGGDGQRFGPDGQLYANATKDKAVVKYETPDKKTKVCEGFRGNDLVVLNSGAIYDTDPFEAPGNSKVYYISPKGEKKVVDTGLKFANGITVSPDQTLLYVADSRTHWVYSYVIQPDGTLANKQKYYHLYQRDTDDDTGADGMRCDRDGRLWVATRAGLQVCDQAGRVNCIIPTPNGKVSNLTFGGENMDVLYATCGDKVYSRKVKVKGANAFEKPFKPAPPRL